VKAFKYFWNTEGGMEVIDIEKTVDLEAIPYWKEESVLSQDLALEHFMGTAEVGDFHHHRLGCLVRVKDTI
jgi:hypothetical protein